MPSSFPSKSHGQIPIGFFNIETDMFLLDRYFFSSTGFKQKPDGTQNRPAVEAAIQPFAVPLKIPILFHQDSPTSDFGEYTFSVEVFQDIIGYIQAGGMPGWLNGQPPDYVTRMMAHLAITSHRFCSEQSTRSVS